MQTAAYIDESTREAVRSRSISYLETDIAAGLTLAEYRRTLRPRGGAATLGGRARRALARFTDRYPDDPTGDYETTAGGW
jgi:hypothetical protein